MARYGKEHKQATRRRIIEAAGRRLKRDGIDGSGIATLMADAGLTNGAFYAHFESKEDLVANAVVEQLREQRESFSAQPPGRTDSSRSSARIFRFSTATTPKTAAHPPPCSTRSGARRTQSKRAYTDGLLVVIDDIAARLAPDDPHSARVKTLSVFALMVGTLQVSRALADRQLADEVLEQGIQNALALLGAEHQS